MKNKIQTLLKGFIASAKSPVILGGHFAVINNPKNNEVLIPAIFQDCEDVGKANWMKNHPYMSYFPYETFSMSLELLKEQSNARLLLLVNDWQQVKNADIFIKRELRQSFYFGNKLPRSFVGLADEEDVNIMEKIFHSPEENTYYKSFYWSETILRTKFENNARYKSCTLGNSCAQEFMPLLHSCENAGIDKLIAMIPATCAYPILDAINEFRNIYDGKMDIMTVFFTNTSSLEKFWEVTVFINGTEVTLGVSV